MAKRRGQLSKVEEVHEGSLRSSSASEDDDTADETRASNAKPLWRSRSDSKLKSCVVLILVLSGALIAMTSFVLFSESEMEEFETTSLQAETRISGGMLHRTAELNGVLADFSDSVTSFTQAENVEWPYLQVPHFDLLAARSLSGGMIDSLLLAPLVQEEERQEWEAFSVQARGNTNFTPSIYRLHGWGSTVNQTGPGPFAPLWQSSPPLPDSISYNYDLLSGSDWNKVFQDLRRQSYNGTSATRPLAVVSPFLDLIQYEEEHFVKSEHSVYAATSNFEKEKNELPRSLVLYPIFDSFSTSRRELRAVLFGMLRWDRLLSSISTSNMDDMTCVISNSCGQTLTFLMSNATVQFLGVGDMHNIDYDDVCLEQVFVSTDQSVQKDFSCEFSVQVCPAGSQPPWQYGTLNALFTAGVVSALFFGTVMLFYIYIYFIRHRQERILRMAKNANAVVSSLFPSFVQGRLFQHAEDLNPLAFSSKRSSQNSRRFSMNSRRFSINSSRRIMEQTNLGECDDFFASKPIADLFLEATVLFGDIAGFTAWSSAREPSQVFQLLESIYYTFDELARRRRVFKVETIGDCYVAVTGVPNAMEDHAVVMTRFAKECLHAMNFLTKRLEVALGPETGNLSMRFGIHSGPVTAGVLRGERSRFQLFGDTVNTASKMESSGQRGRIQVSEETAEELMKAGKEEWCIYRSDKVEVKGKGELTTYWIDAKAIHGGGNVEECLHPALLETRNITESVVDLNGTDEEDGSFAHRIPSKSQRLIDWNVEQLHVLLKQIEARRQALEMINSSSTRHDEEAMFHAPSNGEVNVIDEVKEIISMPDFDSKVAKSEVDLNAIGLSEDALWQLHDFVTVISTMYRDNPFHNFEHASHVCMSVMKLMARVVTPEQVKYASVSKKKKKKNRPFNTGSQKRLKSKIASELHDYSFGITSDPMTQFAVVFSALIHDVDHSGVPNAQLILEGSRLAVVYKNKSVAEQNSVNIAWDLLMDPAFIDLRQAIFQTKEEFQRFRELVINTVMATDIVDKQLKELRNLRWEKAFREKDEEDSKEDLDRRATIVIEHLIQASDVAHTMQHWEIYRKWNERLFREMYSSFANGRTEKNPSDFWYQGELGFFDFYIIPLAKKLRDCGVFGVSCDEYLNYARENRAEWEKKGLNIVEEMKQKVEMEYARGGEEQKQRQSSFSFLDEAFD